MNKITEHELFILIHQPTWQMHISMLASERTEKVGRILHTMGTFIEKYAKMMTEHFGDAQ